MAPAQARFHSAENLGSGTKIAEDTNLRTKHFQKACRATNPPGGNPQQQGKRKAGGTLQVSGQLWYVYEVKIIKRLLVTA